MPKPTVKQQERARTRIRQLIASKPTTKTRTEEKIRLGRKLGYSGKNANIARSVDRLVTRDRDSVSARNLSDVKQVKAIDRAWYSRTRNITTVNKNQELSVLPYVPSILTYDDFIDNDKSVWTTRNVPKVLFRDKSGMVIGDIYIIVEYSDGTILGNERAIFSFWRGLIPLAETFGYLNNKNDLYYLFNQRIEILFQRAGDSDVNTIVFKETSLTDEERESLTRPLKLVIGDYKPDTLNQREMV
jgi:hypothetical protein